MQNVYSRNKSYVFDDSTSSSPYRQSAQTPASRSPFAQMRNVTKTPAAQTQRTPQAAQTPMFKQPAANAVTFAPGDRVRHMTFGDGEVLSVRPMGADTLYEVMFDKVGTKKLMATYAKLKKI